MIRMPRRVDLYIFPFSSLGPLYYSFLWDDRELCSIEIDGPRELARALTYETKGRDIERKIRDRRLLTSTLSPRHTHNL